MQRSPRIIGLDAARGLAIIGMFIAHVSAADDGPFDWGTPGTWTTLADGRSSILFALCAGISFTLLTRRRGPDDPLPVRRRRMLLRAVAIFTLGALLVPLGAANVILPTYAVLFVATLPLIEARTRTLLLAAGASLVLGPVVAVAGAPLVAAGREDSISTLLVSFYPAVSWWSVVLVGAVLGRLDLRRLGTQVRLLAGGTAAAIVGYGAGAMLRAVLLPNGGAIAGPEKVSTKEGMVIVPEGGFRPGDWGSLLGITPHSGSSFELLGALGVAVGVLGALLLASRSLGLLLRPLAAAGAMSLTLYVAHLVAIRAWIVPAAAKQPPDGPDVPLLVMIGSALILAVVWQRFLGSGPLERLVRRISRTLDDRTPEPGPAPESAPWRTPTPARD